jgi:apolipoprotein N-acyltransferase
MPGVGRKRAAAVAAGLLLAAALPGPGLWPLVIAVPGLLRRALAGEVGWRAFRLGWLAGFAQWAAAVPWVVIVLHRYGHLPLPLAVGLWLVMAGILGSLWAVAAWAAAWTPRTWQVWSLPVALTALEVLQRFPPWGFPWNPVAAALTAAPTLLAPVAVVGASGLSLLVLLLSSGLTAACSRSERKVGLVVVGTALAVWVVLSLAAPPFRPTGRSVTAAALQPNVPLEVRWDLDNERAIEAGVVALTVDAAAAGAGWIVWPESAIPRIVERDGGYRLLLERLAREQRAWLLVGSIGFGRGEEEYFNSVHIVSPAGILPFRYDKVHLVPFGEYVPLLGRLAVARSLVREVGAFTPGTARLPLPGPAGPTGVAICYEVAFPALLAEEVRQGAEILATITNDGWYGDSFAPRQHLALAALRAAETRRFLVRAANTGISAIVGPDGRILERLGMGKRGLVVHEVEGGGGVTPAVACGGSIRAAIVLVLVAAILAGGRRRRREHAAMGGYPPRGNDA